MTEVSATYLSWLLVAATSALIIFNTPWTTLITWIKAKFVKPSPVVPSAEVPIDAYMVLQRKLSSIPEAKAALKVLWQYLEPAAPVEEIVK